MFKTLFRTFVATTSAIVFTLAGCEPITPGPAPQVRDSISASELASRLGMQVVSIGPAVASLQGPTDRIVIIPGEPSRLLVNGTDVHSSGDVSVINGTIHLAPSTETKIRRMLIINRTPAPAPSVQTQYPLQPVGALPAGATVMIDPGHGAKDPGTKSVVDPNTKEKEVNLAVSLILADALRRRGVNVLMTRQTDRFIELEQRAEMSNAKRVDLFLSIHCNWTGDTNAQGYILFAKRSPTRQSVRAAGALASSLDHAGFRAYGKTPVEKDFIVLAQNTRPALLVELGFMSNRAEAIRLVSPTYQRNIANAIADGVVDYLRR